MNERYVKDQFSASLIADVKAFGDKGEKKWTDIPPGAAKPRSFFPEDMTKGPPIKYNQKEK